MPTIAEMNVLYTGNDSNFQTANNRVKAGLVATTDAATDAGTAVDGLMERVSALAGVLGPAATESRALAAGLRACAKGAGALDGAMDVAKAGAYAAALASMVGPASALSAEFATLQRSVSSLNRSFASQNIANYGTKAQDSAVNVGDLGTSAAAAEPQIAALNAELARMRTLKPGTVNVGGGGAGGDGRGIGQSALGTAGMQVGRALTRDVTVPILAAGAASIYVATQFDAAMTKVQALSGISKQQTQEWGKEILALGPKIGIMPTELAKGLFYVANEIKGSGRAMEVLTEAGKMSAIGMGETLSNAKALTFVLHDYASANMTAAHASDILVAATRVGNFDTETLTTNLGKLLPIASAMKIPFDQVAGAIAAMTKEGATVPQATTGLARMLQNLEKPSKAAQADFKLIHMSAAEVAHEMQTDLFGALVRVKAAADAHNVSLTRLFTTQNSWKAALAGLGDNLEDSRRSFDEVAHSADSLARAMGITDEGEMQDFKKTLASIEAAGISLGHSLSPIAQVLALDIKDLADEFAGLDKDTQLIIVRLALLLAAIGPVITAFGLLEKAMVLAKGANVGMNLALWLTVPAGNAAAGGLATAGAGATRAAGLFAALKTEINGARLAMTGLSVAVAAYGGWEVGSLISKKFDEGAQENGYDNFGSQLYGKLGGMSDLFDVSGGQHKTGDEQQAEAETGAPGFYGKWNSPAAFKMRKEKADRQKAAAELRSYLAELNAIDAAKKAGKPKPGSTGGGDGSSSGADGSSSGGKQSDAQREQDQRLQGLKDRLQSLGLTIRMYGNESDSAAMKDELLFGEFATDAQKARGLALAMKQLGAANREHAAMSLYGTAYEKLSPQQKDSADVLAMTRLTEARKAATEALKAYKEEIQGLNKDVAKANADVLIAKATSDEDAIALEKYGKAFAALTDPTHIAGIKALAKAAKDLKAAQYDGSEAVFDDGSELAQKYRDEKNKAAASVDPSKAAFDDGSEAAAAQKKRYLDTFASAMRTLTKELDNYGKASKEARVQALQFDETGQKMTKDQATQIVQLQDYVAKVKAIREHLNEIAEQGASIISGGVQRIMEHGTRGLGGYLQQSVQSTVKDDAVKLVQSKAKEGLDKVLGLKKQDPMVAAINKNIAALNQNTQALTGSDPATPGTSGGDSGFLSTLGGSSGSQGLGGFLGSLSQFAPFIPHFADGGNFSGGNILVGERGPEIINMGSRSGSVTSNDKLGGTVNHNYDVGGIHIHGDASERNQLSAKQHADRIFKHLRAAHNAR